jgi:hypothetical protein
MQIEGLAHGLSVDLTSQPEVCAMARLVRQMTTAVWFSATAADRGDRTAAKITQVQDLGQYAGAQACRVRQPRRFSV